MKNYTINVTTQEEQTLFSPASKFLKVTVGNSNVDAKILKIGQGAAEEDFTTLTAGQLYYFRASLGYFRAVIAKVATGSGTLTVEAGDDDFFRTDNVNFKHQSDSFLSQDNPVNGQRYTVLEETQNVRLISVAVAVDWTVQPTTLRIYTTIDGIEYQHGFTNPVTATAYYCNITGLSTTATLSTTTPTSRPFYLEGRNIKVEAYVSGGTVQLLRCRVVWAKR
jgi:hypothetical protein